MRVMFDVGHGGGDSGAVGNGLVEKELNLYTARRAQDLLRAKARAAGISMQVALSRESDVSLSRSARLRRIASFNPHICISIHYNSASTNLARGTEVYHSANNHRDDALAKFMIERLAATGMPSRGTKTRILRSGADYYYIIRDVMDEDTVAVLYEGAFVSSPEDADMIKSGWMDQAAEAIAQAVMQFIAEGKWPEEPREVEGPRLLIEGYELPLQIIDGRSYAPVRQLLESLGYTVTWDGETDTVTAHK